MSKYSSKFVVDGADRLFRSPAYQQKLKAEEARIRAKYAPEMAATSDYWERRALESKIQKELKQVQPSTCCLW